MASDVLSVGNKVEFKQILTPQDEEDGRKANSYVSQVYDVAYDRKKGITVTCAMPSLGGRLVPLSLGQDYEAFFFTGRGLYKSRCTVKDRYREGNIYTMEISLHDEPVKYQRRQYYRLDKSLPVLYAGLSDNEYLKIIETRQFPDNLRSPDAYDKGNTVDISGGGLRFIGRSKVESGRKMLVIFDIDTGEKQIKFRLPASVIMSFEMPDRQGFYEHRVEFENISSEYREILIKYIFEEERKLRKRTR